MFLTSETIGGIMDIIIVGSIVTGGVIFLVIAIALSLRDIEPKENL
jgi:hypothetical protein